MPLLQGFAKGTQFLDNSGNPLARGTLSVYEANTSTLATLTSNGSTAAPNPITLDGSGRLTFGVWVLLSVDVVIKDSTGATVANPQGLGAVRIVSVDDYGAAGDDTADDAAAINAADAAAAGGLVLFTPGKTYRAASQLDCTGEWNLQGARIHLVLNGNVRGIEMESNTWLHNGIIKKTGTGTVSSGEFQCHVKAGRFDTPTGKQNVRISDLVLETVDGGASNQSGISIASGTHNFIVENILARASSSLGRVVVCHWGNLAAYASTGTGHPHNGIIRNIYSEGLTLVDNQTTVVGLSGCYNVSVENVHAEYVTYNFLTDYAGDRGFRYAPALEQPMAQKGNSFRNCSLRECGNNSGQIVFCNGEPVLETAYPNRPNTVFDGITIIGTASGANTNGFEIVHAGKVKVTNSVVKNFVHGIIIGEGCAGTIVENSEFSGNSTYGVNVSDNTTPPEDVTVADNYCYENGTAGIRTSASYRTTIRDNKLGNRSGTDSTQNYGIEIGTADRWHEIVNNHFHAYTVAGILAPTSAGQYFDVFNGNTFDDLTAPIIGQDFIPYARVPTPDGTTILWHGVGNATPEGSVTAPPGSTCVNTSNGKHYTKSSGTGNTGWVVTGTQT